MALFSFTRIDPTQFITVPWKNGGGTSLTIAQQHRGNAGAGDWSSLIWQLGRTAIVAPAPFSDLSGFDRMQILLRGSGLVLQSPDGELDVRKPYRPVRFKGSTPIVSRLEAGPVEVLNLMAASDLAAIDLVVLTPGIRNLFQAGVHILYAPDGQANLDCNGETTTLADNHAARVDGTMTLKALDGILVVASVMLRPQGPAATGKKGEGRP